jgi:hypothetical protein
LIFCVRQNNSKEQTPWKKFISLNVIFDCLKITSLFSTVLYILCRVYNNHNPHPYVIRIRWWKFKNMCISDKVIKRALFPGAVSIVNFTDRNRSKKLYGSNIWSFKKIVVIRYEKFSDLMYWKYSAYWFWAFMIRNIWEIQWNNPVSLFLHADRSVFRQIWLKVCR